MERHEAVTIFVDSFYEIISALEALEEGDKTVTSLHRTACSFPFILTAVVMENLLAYTYILSKQLQKEDMNILQGLELLGDVVTSIQHLRNEECFKRIFEKAVEMAERVGVAPENLESSEHKDIELTSLRVTVSRIFEAQFSTHI